MAKIEYQVPKLTYTHTPITKAIETKNTMMRKENSLYEVHHSSLSIKRSTRSKMVAIKRKTNKHLNKQAYK